MSTSNQRYNTPTAVDLDVEQDGKSHVNIFTRGKTKLGRDLSNFHECNIEHPFYGRFRTLEGLWHFLKTGCKDDMYRLLNGHDARKRGQAAESTHYPLFTKMFKLGMVEKLAKNKDLQKALMDNNLPLVHYYTYGGAVHVPQRHEWQIEFWETMREALLVIGNVDMIRDELVEYVNRVQGTQSKPDEAHA